MEMENAVINSLAEEKGKSAGQIPPPDELDIFPILKRPFFPGMAAPVVIDPGPYFDVIKKVAKSDHKCIGLVLTKKEDTDIYTATFKDLFPIGVMARILRVIP